MTPCTHVQKIALCALQNSYIKFLFNVTTAAYALLCANSVMIAQKELMCTVTKVFFSDGKTILPNHSSMIVFPLGDA